MSRGLRQSLVDVANIYTLAYHAPEATARYADGQPTCNLNVIGLGILVLAQAIPESASAGGPDV